MRCDWQLMLFVRPALGPFPRTCRARSRGLGFLYPYFFLGYTTGDMKSESYQLCPCADVSILYERENDMKKVFAAALFAASFSCLAVSEDMAKIDARIDAAHAVLHELMNT